MVDSKSAQLETAPTKRWNGGFVFPHPRIGAVGNSAYQTVERIEVTVSQSHKFGNNQAYRPLVGDGCNTTRIGGKAASKKYEKPERGFDTLLTSP